MPERLGDLSIFADALPKGYDAFRRKSDRWIDDIPGMPYPGMPRANAWHTYDHIVNAFTNAQAEMRQLMPQDIRKILDADKKQIDSAMKRQPANDYTLNNVLAIGIWQAREEFEKEEAGTPQYQMFNQVNSLIRLAIDLVDPPQPFYGNK